MLYILHIAIDPDFSFAESTAATVDTSAMLDPELEWGFSYWWKVRAHDLIHASTWSNQVFSFRTVMLGDADGNGRVNISDAVFIKAYIYGSGPAPVPLFTGDTNCSGRVNIADVVYLVAYIFGVGPPPCEPETGSTGNVKTPFQKATFPAAGEH